MDVQPYVAAGYAPIPLRDSRHVLPHWRLRAQRFPDDCHEVGIVAHRRVSTAGPYSSVARTWCSAVVIETPDAKLRVALVDAVKRICGPGPMRAEGNEILRPFRVDARLVVGPFPPQYLPGEPFTSLKYRPHRFEFITDSYFRVDGGRWSGGSIPETPRDELPRLDVEMVERLRTEAQQIFKSKGAEPWV